MPFERVIESHIAMEHLGSELWHHLSQSAMLGMVIYLIGSLGAGKTTLVRGLLRAMHYQGTVKSPTYTLVETYEVDGKKVAHFDFYRVHDPYECEMMGIRDYFQDDTCCLIEWPEKGQAYLAKADITLTIVPEGDVRKVTFSSGSLRGKNVLKAFQV